MANVFLYNGALFNKTETAHLIAPSMHDIDCQKVVIIGLTGSQLPEQLEDDFNEEAEEIFRGKAGLPWNNNFTRVVKSGEVYLLRHTVAKSTKNSVEDLINVLKITKQVFGLQLSVGDLSSLLLSQRHALLVWYEEGKVHFWDFHGERTNWLEYWGAVARGCQAEA